ncbi:hypothetical protein, partial [Bradyrhizobium valentinum]|uniref:hypothetical protein n=1 Tax=Bradyrhizobium valentinum TaxID=1518501 RepID=UPI001AECF5ED
RNHARAAEPGPQQNDHTMPLLRRRRSITHAQKNHDAVKLAKRNPPLFLARKEVGYPFGYLTLVGGHPRPDGEG